MPIGHVAPFTATMLALALAVVFTRLWVNDTASRAARELEVLGFRPGRTYRLGGSWTLHAVRERGNRALALLAVAGWVAVGIVLDLVRR